MVQKNFVYGGYDSYLYTGLQGFVMRQNHRILSQGVDPSKNRRILEIGGAAKPHCSLVTLLGVEEYWISDTEEIFAQRTHQADPNIRHHFFDKDPDYKAFRDTGTRFSRIIASHVWST